MQPRDAYYVLLQKIAHYVLAEDIDGVKKVLAEKQTYNLNFRNLVI